MSLLAQIKIDRMQAMKDRNAFLKDTLTTVYSDAANVGLNDGKRESTDAEVIAVLKKFIKGVNETIDAMGARDTTILIAERSIYEEYLPKQLSEDELTAIISSIVSTIDGASMKSMGEVMSQLKTKHQGEFDGKLASTVVRTVLSSQ